MTRNGQETEIVEETASGRNWLEVDIDEQDYLDRVASFGEGYFDLSTFFGSEESGEIGFMQA
jgi:hypothetical protein